MDWESRYRAGDTPWDLGRPHPELVRRLEVSLIPSGERRALVPGCGRGHDAVALANAGWKVIAVDLVASLEESVSRDLSGLGGEFRSGDVFALDIEPVDFLWDHTFFCSLDPLRRVEFGELAQRVLREGGRLASVVYPLGKVIAEGGPPWGMTVEQLEDVLRTDFDLVEDDPIFDRGHQSWDERWALFERREDVDEVTGIGRHIRS